MLSAITEGKKRLHITSPISVAELPIDAKYTKVRL